MENSLQSPPLNSIEKLYDRKEGCQKYSTFFEEFWTNNYLDYMENVFDFTLNKIKVKTIA